MLKKVNFFGVTADMEISMNPSGSMNARYFFHIKLWIEGESAAVDFEVSKYTGDSILTLTDASEAKYTPSKEEFKRLWEKRANL